MLLWTLGACIFSIGNFSFFKYISRSGIAGLCGNSNFNFLRNLCTIFHICTSLQSHQQYTSFSFSPHSHQHFLITTILTCVSWYLMVVLLCIPITIRVAEYFSYTCHIFWSYVCLLCKNVYKFFFPCLIKLHVSLLLRCSSSLCIRY